LIGRARYLRRAATVAERRLWKALRRDGVDGLHFRRQQPIGPYIADFFCPSAKLVIELDGYFHTAPLRIEQDAARTAWLRARGYRVLRLRNELIFDAFEAVLDAIREAVLP